MYIKKRKNRSIYTHLPMASYELKRYGPKKQYVFKIMEDVVVFRGKSFDNTLVVWKEGKNDMFQKL